MENLARPLLRVSSASPASAYRNMSAYRARRRQYHCRFKRSSPFSVREEDEAFMRLGTFRRNDRWHLPFPHARRGNPSKN